MELSKTTNPISIFEQWYKDAELAGIEQVEAVSLATSTRSGKPSVRMVLLKEFTESGFVFYTNYESRKGQELNDNPFAAMAIYWFKLERQIRIEGRIERLSREESYRYFASRPRGSQLGALASHQSRTLSSREELEKNYQSLEKQYAGKEIPCPDYWGGFRLIPEVIEFWQGRRNRLHERLQFKISGGKWMNEQLSP